MKRGVFIAILVIVVVLVALFVVGGLIYMQFTQEPYIPDQAYLKIDVSGPLVESSTPGLSGVFGSELLSIRDLWFQLERAAMDKRIKGVILKINYFDGGFAKTEEIGRLLERFRQSKKPVVAMLEDGGLKEYYLSSFADKVVIFRGAWLSIKGIAAEAMFLKNTLAKLGVQAEMFHIGDYKTGYNAFTENKMTPAHRESMQALIDDIYQALINGIARNRKLDAAAVRRVLDQSPLPIQDYLKAGFVDAIGTNDELRQWLKNEHPLVKFATYRKTSSPNPFNGPKKIAIIFASGEIRSGKSGSDSVFGGEVLGSDSLVEELRSARTSSMIKAVVLRVDSPGGSAVASDVILREAEELAKKKPLVLSMSDMAASGGYWISMASTKILTLPETITGSIGVLSGKFVLKGLYDKLGVSKEFVSTSPYAVMYSDYRPFTPAERGKIMADMQRVYDEFLKKVAANRSKSTAEVDKIGRGRVWSGDAALRLNLVDGIGGLADAVAEAKKLAKIPTAEAVGVRIYPRKRSLIDLILQLGGDASARPTLLDIETRIRSLAKNYFPALRMPFVLQLN